MNNLIIDTASEKIFLKIISDSKEYNIKHDNSRENFDELVNLIFEFLTPMFKVDEEISRDNRAVGIISFIISVGVSFVIGAGIIN